MASKVNHYKKQIADLFSDFAGVTAVDGCFQLSRFFVELVKDLRRILPVKPDLGSLFRQLQALEQPWEMDRHFIEGRFQVLFFFTRCFTFVGLQLVPVNEDIFGTLKLGSAEYMRMS